MQEEMSLDRFAVGTQDQALMVVMNLRHRFVRAFGTEYSTHRR